MQAWLADNLEHWPIERLLPYIEQCVLSIDLAAGEMRVDWDADF